MEDKIIITCSGAYLFVNYTHKKKILSTYEFDLIDFKESQRVLLRQLLHHWCRIPLVITWEDYKYLRKLKIIS